MKSCENCQFCEFDYIFNEDTGEEYPFYGCEKGNDISKDFECQDYQEDNQISYKEEDTECDKCEHLSKCIENGNVVNSRTIMDIKPHYVVGREGCYKKVIL